ncbi:MAG: hypothetical protein MJB14_17375, partial [Spirochaetes bacterium]|nr:hypothetical protein [Spirochaetota bacterium]
VIFITKLLTNFLPIDTYGKYAWVVEYGLFFSVAANLGIFANSVRLISASPANSILFINALFLRIVTAASFFIIAVMISIFISSGDFFVLSCIIFTSSLLVDFVTMICDAYLQANYKMGRATLALVLGKATQFVLIFLIIRVYPAQPDSQFIPIIVFVTLTGSLVTALFSLIFVFQKLKFECKIDLNLCWSIFKSGIFFGLINIFNYLYFRFIPIALAKLYLSDSEFGSFDISYRIAFVLSLFSTFLMFSVMPAFIRSLKSKEWHISYKIFFRASLILALCSVLLVGLGTWLGPMLIRLLTNKSFVIPQLWFIFSMFLILAAVSYFYDLVLITLFSIHQDFWLLKQKNKTCNT